MDATTTICHRYTPPDQLALLTRTADIIVTAAGQSSLFLKCSLSYVCLIKRTTTLNIETTLKVVDKYKLSLCFYISKFCLLPLFQVCQT
jgi:5,10-methylene-tetrahydrofolate dehydrogenase/Methenyl tetrahydrofolate cyclohydrolase